MIKNIKLIRNARIVGKCKLEITNNIAWITHVMIYKQYRGIGYSKYLITKALNFAKRMKVRNLFLHVKNDNDVAIKTYKRVGFKIIKKNYENSKLFGYTMRMRLV